MEVHWIDKLDIVRRQIKEAVRLFFEQRDAVVIHTIVASAHQILFDLGESKGIASVVKNTAALKGDEIQSFLHSINYPYNFFKHADRDPDAKINVGPLERFTQDFIMDAIVMLQRLCGNIPTEAKVYWVWFVSKYREEFDDCPADGEIKKMQEQGLASWDFPTICQFLTFCDLAEGANNSLNSGASKTGAG
jgi:hypothetical protein